MFKFLVILLIVGGLIALGILYIKKRFRAFIGRMIDPRQFGGDSGFGSMNTKPRNTINDKEIYNKDGVKVYKGEAGKNGN